jgi:hypothetical protein
MPGLGLETIDVGGGESLGVLVFEGRVLHHPVPGLENAVDVLF